MKELGKISLPDHFVKGLGLERNACRVIVTRENESVRLQCSLQNERTPSDCRADYEFRGKRISGCPLRARGYKQELYLLSKNLGIKLVD